LAKYYEGLKQITEAEILTANDLLAQGWQLLAIKDKTSMQGNTGPVYVMGRFN